MTTLDDLAAAAEKAEYTPMLVDISLVLRLVAVARAAQEAYEAWLREDTKGVNGVMTDIGADLAALEE